MAADKKVAGYHVTLGVQGVQKAKAMVKSAVKEIGSQVATVKANVADMFGTFNSSSMAILGGAGAAGMFKGFIQPAMEGTLEARRLGEAMTNLQRVVGDGLAPYVRTLTTAIVHAAEAFRKLSPETKDMVVRIGLIGMAVGTLMAMMPLLSAAFSLSFGLAAAAIGLLLSPIGIAVAAIVGLIYLGNKLWNEISGASTSGANNIQKSNKTWISSMIDGMKEIATVFASVFNTISQWFTDFANFVPKVLTQLGQAAGVLEKNESVHDALAKNMVTSMKMMGLIDAARESALKGQIIGQQQGFVGMKPLQIDVTKMREGFDNVAEVAERKAADLKDIFKDIGDLFPGGKKKTEGWFSDYDGDEDKPTKGFTRLYKVQIEDGRGSYDRLLQAFAGGGAESTEKQILDENKETNDHLKGIYEKVKNFASLRPPSVVTN